jgi:predicted SAM-dependent methyltransferase
MTLRNLIKRLLPERTLKQVIPNSSIISELWWEARAIALHYTHARRVKASFKGKRGIRANIGCGSRPKDGWYNIDIQKSPGIMCWDLRRGLPFDESVSVIYSEHVFEHLDRPHSTVIFLSECLRCLEPGGVLRVVVPDAGMYLDAYAARDWDTFIRNRPLEVRQGGYYDHWLHEKYQTQMELVNAVFRQRSEHKYAYDSETLLLDLRSAGFSLAKRQEFGKSEVRGAAIDSAQRASESLYVEGIK